MGRIAFLLALGLLGCSVSNGDNVPSPRIVSLVPSATETLYLLGAGGHIVGVSNVDSSRGKVIVGSMLKPDYEKILSLKPDIVIITLPMQRKVKEELEKAGLKTIAVNPESIQSIFNSIIQLGKLVRREERAYYIVDSLRSEMESILNGRKFRYRAFVEIWYDPLYTAGDSTFIDDIIEHLGLENVFSDRRGYFQVQQEEVIERNPEVIIISHKPSKPPQRRKFWESVSAVRNGYIIYIDPDLLNRPGPGFVRAMDFLVNTLDSFSNSYRKSVKF